MHSIIVYCIYFLSILIDVQLIYKVAGIQQSDQLYIYININIYIFRLSFMIGYYKILSIVPYAMQKALIYLFYIQQYALHLLITYCISGAEHFTRNMAHKFKWISAFMDLTAWGRGERRGNTKKRIMKINLEIVIIAINKIISEEWGYG